MKNHKLALSIVAGCLALVMSAGTVFAQSPSPTMKPKATLAPGRMKSCESKQSAVRTQLTQLIRMASNMLEVFDRHVMRLKEYYTSILIPKGITLSNYDTLVSDIASKRSAVESAWDKAKSDSQGFSCVSGEPRSLLTQFRSNMQATKKALFDYRLSVRNLLLALRKASPSPVPSASPTATPTSEAE